MIGFIGFASTVLLIAASCNAQQIPVTVYYESLCPDSQAFITRQLYPVMKTPLGKLVQLKLIPYGKSNYTTEGSETKFTCHHGANECFGNKVQSCAIEHIQVDSFQSADTRDSKTLDFVTCLMQPSNNFADSVYPGKKCSDEIKLRNWEIISQCANSTEGSNLLQRNGEATNALLPALTSVPTITFRHQYDAAAQAQALTNFGMALCQQYSEPRPQECRSALNGASAPAAIIATMLTGLMAAMLVAA